MRSRLVRTIAVLLALVDAGAARAQSCAQINAGVTRCRLLLSQSRIYEVRAYARLGRPPAPGPHALVLSIDGVACHEQGATTGFFGRVVDAGCLVSLSPGTHLAEAQADPATPDVQGVSIRMQPNPRLAPLPREAPTLYPSDHRPWFRRILPF